MTFSNKMILYTCRKNIYFKNSTCSNKFENHIQMVLRTLKGPDLTKIIIQTDNNSGYKEKDIASCLLTTDCMSHKMQGCYKRKNIFVLIKQLY